MRANQNRVVTSVRRGGGLAVEGTAGGVKWIASGVLEAPGAAADARRDV